jgi:hypothetical protein
MAQPSVLRVLHDDLAGGMLQFSDDEVVELLVRRPQIVVEQESQTGSLTAVYLGTERYEFDIAFNVFRQTTLHKLEAIRQLRATFRLRPFIYEETLTEFIVFWPQEPTMQERWVRGRRAAQWDFPITWKESRVVQCPPVAAS